MCGILGIFGLDNAVEFLASQNHRGPNNTGICDEAEVFLDIKIVNIGSQSTL